MPRKNLMLKISGTNPRLRGYHVIANKDMWKPERGKSYGLIYTNRTIKVVNKEGEPTLTMMDVLCRLEGMKELVQSEIAEVKVINQMSIENFEGKGEEFHVEYLFYKNVNKKKGKPSHLSDSRIGKILSNIEKGRFLLAHLRTMSSR